MFLSINFLNFGIGKLQFLSNTRHFGITNVNSALYNIPKKYDLPCQLSSRVMYYTVQIMSVTVSPETKEGKKYYV